MTASSVSAPAPGAYLWSRTSWMAASTSTRAQSRGRPAAANSSASALAMRRALPITRWTCDLRDKARPGLSAKETGTKQHREAHHASTCETQFLAPLDTTPTRINTNPTRITPCATPIPQGWPTHIVPVMRRILPSHCSLGIGKNSPHHRRLGRAIARAVGHRHRKTDRQRCGNSKRPAWRPANQHARRKSASVARQPAQRGPRHSYVWPPT